MVSRSGERARVRSVTEVVYWVSDVERAVAWYQDRFDMVLTDHSPGQHAFLDAGSFLLAFFNPADPGSDLGRSYLARTGGVRGDVYHVAFAVEPSSLDGNAATIRETGTEVKGPVEFESGRRSYFFEDPDGHYIELTDR